MKDINMDKDAQELVLGCKNFTYDGTLKTIPDGAVVADRHFNGSDDYLSIEIKGTDDNKNAHIKLPCMVGDMVWYIDDIGNVTWGYVAAFTEKHILTFGTRSHLLPTMDFLPFTEYGKSIFTCYTREKAEEMIYKNVEKGDYSYFSRFGYKTCSLSANIKEILQEREDKNTKVINDIKSAIKSIAESGTYDFRDGTIVKTDTADLEVLE